MTKCLWTPSDARISASLLSRFMREHAPFDGYDALWECSVADRADFWSAAWEFCGVVAQKGEATLSPSDHMIDDRFFPDGTVA